jgi:hypothetical protein
MEDKKNVWELIKSNQFDEACIVADEQYLLTKNRSILNNKVLALLQLQKYTDVIDLCDKNSNETDGETDVDFIFSGIAYWALDNQSKAIEYWKKGEKAKYADIAGGMDVLILQYFSSVKLNDDKLLLTVKKKIKKLLKNKMATNFYGLQGNYLLDEITETELLSSLTKTNILRERQLCSMDLVLSIKALETKDFDLYIKKLTDCVSYGSNSYLEHSLNLAKVELNKVSL